MLKHWDSLISNMCQTQESVQLKPKITLYYYILPSTQLQYNIMLVQHVSTYSSHLQAKLRTVNALQGGCAHLGSHMAYSAFAVVFLRT